MSHEPDAADYPIKGRWSGQETSPGDHDVLNDGDGVYAIHAALMHTGRVLLFSGRTDESGGNANLYRSWSWDPTGHISGQPLTGVEGRWFVPGFDENAELPVDADGNPDIAVLGDADLNLFCAFQVFREDGKLLVVGGDSPSLIPGSPGTRHPAHDNRSLHVYDPELEEWSKLPSPMYKGRWYPTCVLMPNSAITIFSGNTSFGFSGITSEVEVVAPPFYTPERVSGGLRTLFIYPGMHLVPGGRVFYTTTAWRYNGSDEAEVESRLGSTDSFVLSGRNSAGEPAGAWQPQAILPDNPLREEGTSVLLPPARAGRILLIGGGWWKGGNLLGDATSVEILDTQKASLAWEPAGNMNFARVNVTSVLLPNGKVLILGGHTKHKWDHDHDGTIDHGPGVGHDHDLSVHSNIAEIYDPSISYDSTDPTAAFIQVAEMHRPRLYHSIALLLPDGRVLTAGGIEAERNMEIYEPPYLHQGVQPEIDSILRNDVTAPSDNFIKQIQYGGEITIGYTTEAPINKVVLMRPGAVTHHTNTDQRYEDISIPPASGASGTFRVRIPGDPSVLPPGYYMLWIVDDQGRPCQQARFVRLSHEACSVIADRSHLSIHAYNATKGATGIAEFPASIYLVLRGFIPREIGITDLDPDLTGAVPPTYVPDIDVLEGGALVGEIEIYPIAMHLEHPVDVEHPAGSVDVRQRITFEYGIRITAESVFPVDDGDATTIEQRELQLKTETRGYTCTGKITLARQPNPYMLDGETPWLSTDLRVFQVQENSQQSGITLGDGEAPLTYLSDFISACGSNTDATSVTHPFEKIATNQQDAELELAPMTGDNLVYNFAIARVRMRAPAGVNADGVHVFFRLFTTAVASLQYNTDTTYRRSNVAPFIAEIAQTADEILTIPCYATPRASVAGSGDTPNILSINGTGDDQFVYYGAWLDINQTTTPLTNPATGEPISVKNSLRNLHQCLCAEIFYESDPIPLNATPGSNDNLSQRNLIIVDSDNPGGPNAHTIVHTFDLQPTWGLGKGLDRGEFVAANLPHTFTTNIDVKQVLEARPDELMITWGDLPRDATATVYFPDLDAELIVALAALEGRPGLLERVDAHTVQCPIADITYIPLPVVSHARLAGLLTIELPNTVRDGETYRVTAHHYSRVLGRLLGAFEVLIPVRLAEKLRRREARDFAILQFIASKLVASSRWRPIFERYLGTLADRLRGLDVNPSRIPPSDEGGVPEVDAGLTPSNTTSTCCREQWLFPAVLAVGLVAVGLLPYAWSAMAGATTLVGLVGACCWWRLKCRPRCCDLIAGSLLGTGTAALVIGFIVLSGFRAPQTVLALSIIGVTSGLLILLAWVTSCFRAICYRLGTSLVRKKRTVVD